MSITTTGGVQASGDSYLEDNFAGEARRAYQLAGSANLSVRNLSKRLAPTTTHMNYVAGNAFGPLVTFTSTGGSLFFAPGAEHPQASRFLG